MEFDTKRFLQLAGIPDRETAGPSSVNTAPRPLVESARRAPAMSADEQKLRTIIRREAKKMISERAAMMANSDVVSVQSKKSLTEAITMGFAGFGFGGKSPVLGGPMTSASKFASLYESETDSSLDEGESVSDDEGTLTSESDDTDLDGND